MGVTASCEDLKNTDNPCDVGKCLDSMEMLEKTSQSLARMSIIQFKPNTHYNEKLIKTAFLKIFITPNYERIFNILTYYYKDIRQFEDDFDYISKKTKELYTDVSAINYELEIYKNVIMPLIDYNICPNYISCFATSTKCTFNDVAMLLDNGYSKERIENRESIFKTMAYSLIYGLYDQENEYPDNGRIDIPDGFRKNYGSVVDSICSFLILEAVQNSIKLEDYLRRRDKDIIEINEILFQVVCACYGLFLSETNHNDLHPGNIYLEKHNEPITLHYNINGIVYTLRTKYLVKMFDYDRSYCIYIGDNPFIQDNENLYNHGEENTLSEMRDVWQIIFFLKLHKIDFLSYMSKNDETLKEIRQLGLQNLYFFQDKNRNRIIFNDNLERLCCSIPETLHRIANELKLQDEYKEGIIYNLDKKLFNHGILNVEKLQNRLLRINEEEDIFRDLEKELEKII